jgi:hypothetical protein
MQALTDGTAVYVGRAVPRQGFRASRYANPFKIGLDGNRIDVVLKYFRRLRQQCLDDPLFIVRLRGELKDKVLGCWCAPHEECHADLLAQLADESDKAYQWWLAHGWKNESDPDRIHIILPSGATAQVSPDIDAETVDALNEMSEAALGDITEALEGALECGDPLLLTITLAEMSDDEYQEWLNE